MPRVNLPIADQPYSGPVAYDAKDPESVFPPIEPLRLPAGAPDVLVVLVDDRSLGASNAFGGPCAPPIMERLSVSRLGYNFPHHRAVRPTRSALLTEQNHQTVGVIRSR